MEQRISMASKKRDKIYILRLLLDRITSHLKSRCMSAILRQSSEACLHRLQLELEWQESCPVLATHRLNMSKHTCEMLKLDLVLERLCMGLFQPHHSNLQDTKGQSIPQSPSVFRVVLHTSSFAHPVLFKAPW